MRKNSKSAYLYLLPALLLIGIFVLFPLVRTIGFAFSHFQGFEVDKFVGFHNFKLLFKDKIFLRSVRLTFLWAGMSAVVPGLVGLMLAILLEYRTGKRAITGICRVTLFMPQMLSMVAVGMLWSLIYNPNLGLLNGAMQALGLASSTNPVDILGNSKTALLGAFATTVWHGAGFSMVIFSAALQNISKDVVEAAMIDGANKFQQIRYISIPGIMGTISTVFVINMISGFKAFDILQVLTEGGPANSTLITSLYMYRQAFFAFKFDYASAMATVLFTIIALVTVVGNKFKERINEKYN